MSEIKLSPNDSRYIYFFWSDSLKCEGSPKITASTWVLPTGLTKVSDHILEFNESANTALVQTPGDTTRIKLSGLVAGKSYQIANRVTLSNGDTLERFATVVCTKLSGTLSNTCIANAV